MPCAVRLDKEHAARDAQQRRRLKACVAIASIGFIGLAFLTGARWIFLVSLIGLMGLLVWGHDRTPLISSDHLR
jgi:hypothetical protein